MRCLSGLLRNVTLGKNVFGSTLYDPGRVREVQVMSIIQLETLTATKYVKRKPEIQNNMVLA